ncbi:hypothetical protein PV341_39325 [Streptomyces sp. PA03-1a]|nr:hypothetical protein [Streptomyces sp. PA03-1a]MDX2815343.1 hypothetical protein [Streptomyces sp. PA03-5A]
MTRNDFTPAVRRLAREQDRVATVAQLAAVGVPQSRLREWCRPGGRWQRPLPRVVVLQPGPLTAAQRSRAALAFAGYPQVPAMITGVAGLALHGVAVAAPPCGLPVVDVLVPSERRIRTHTWVRVHHGRGLPVADTVDGVPVAPVARAAADGVRESIDPEWALDVVRELVIALGVPAPALAAELGGAVLARRPAVAALLDAMDPGPRAASAGPMARALVARSGLRQPLWRPTLQFDGAFLASPDAYWVRDGLVLDLGPGTGRGRLESLGLRVLRVAPAAFTRSPAEVVAALRTALAAGPYGPLDRITALPGAM